MPQLLEHIGDQNKERSRVIEELFRVLAGYPTLHLQLSKPPIQPSAVSFLIPNQGLPRLSIPFPSRPRRSRKIPRVRPLLPSLSRPHPSFHVQLSRFPSPFSASQPSASKLPRPSVREACFERPSRSSRVPASQFPATIPLHPRVHPATSASEDPGISRYQLSRDPSSVITIHLCFPASPNPSVMGLKQISATTLLPSDPSASSMFDPLACNLPTEFPAKSTSRSSGSASTRSTSASAVGSASKPQSRPCSQPPPCVPATSSDHFQIAASMIAPHLLHSIQPFKSQTPAVSMRSQHPEISAFNLLQSICSHPCSSSSSGLASIR